MKMSENEALRLLHERLDSHDKSRAALQDALREKHTKLEARVNGMMDKLLEELDKFIKEEQAPLLALIESINLTANEQGSTEQKEAQAEGYLAAGRGLLNGLHTFVLVEEDLQSAKIKQFEILRLKPVPLHVGLLVGAPSSKKVRYNNELASLYESLRDAVNELDENERTIAELINKKCSVMINELIELMTRVNYQLEIEYNAEDTRLQSIVHEIDMLHDPDSSSGESCSIFSSPEEVSRRAFAALTVEQSYGLFHDEDAVSIDCAYKLKTIKKIWKLDERQPKSLSTVEYVGGKVRLSYALFDEEEWAVITKSGISPKEISVRATLSKKDKSGCLDESEWAVDDKNSSITPDFLSSSTRYNVTIRFEHNGCVSKPSKPVEFTTPGFSACSYWKECPENISIWKRYSVRSTSPRVAIKTGDDSFFYGSWSTVIGNTVLPPRKVTSWSIRVLESRDDDCGGIFVGVAPYDVNQNADNHSEECRWYLHCHDSTLYSGPPHKYRWEEYGPRREDGQYVQPGEAVGVVMDTLKGDLSFVVGGVNLGVAFEGIPLDKPLVPCVTVQCKDDSIYFDPSEVKEIRTSSIVSVPSSLRVSSTTWDSITLSWEPVFCASFYQIEMDGSKFWDASTTSAFKKKGLLPDTNHSFRIRAVSKRFVSEWSAAVPGKTGRDVPPFSECVWERCPESVNDVRRYSVDSVDPRVATKVGSGDDYCTITGSTAIPLGIVSVWSIKVLGSGASDGEGVWIGVAPTDVDKNYDKNTEECGWYIYCYDFTLWSGSPHSTRAKEYGPRKECDGKYLGPNNTITVVFDATLGELSFVVNGVNLGVAFASIPLSKPVVPCVVLRKRASVKLSLSKYEEGDGETPSDAIPTLANIRTESLTWNSVTLSWDPVNGASFYQIEVDNGKSWPATVESTYTATGFLPNTEHKFRIRAVCHGKVGKWSEPATGRTQKELFKYSAWRTCHENIDSWMQYSLGTKNPRVATKMDEINLFGCWSTVVGNTPIPSDSVTSWSIKILNSKDNNCEGICVGVAPCDIDQNTFDNFYKCGWYFDCYTSRLWSGPPCNHRGLAYGQRKSDGGYVRTGDTVGVMADTVKGRLSFLINGVNFGVAFGGIMLDKPLVPCVTMRKKGDSIELNI